MRRQKVAGPLSGMKRFLFKMARHHLGLVFLTLAATETKKAVTAMVTNSEQLSWQVKNGERPGQCLNNNSRSTVALFGCFQVSAHSTFQLGNNLWSSISLFGWLQNTRAWFPQMETLTKRDRKDPADVDRPLIKWVRVSWFDLRHVHRWWPAAKAAASSVLKVTQFPSTKYQTSLVQCALYSQVIPSGHLTCKSQCVNLTFSNVCQQFKSKKLTRFPTANKTRILRPMRFTYLCQPVCRQTWTCGLWLIWSCLSWWPHFSTLSGINRAETATIWLHLAWPFVSDVMQPRSDQRNSGFPASAR